MFSIAQQQANQANAALSTGPRTETGKAASSQNARKHGLSAAQLVVLPDEKPIFDELVAASNAGFDPQTEIERSLVDQIIRASWNMRRAGTLEAKLAAQAADPLENPEHADTLNRYRRHTLDAERSYYRALAELRKVQAARASHTPEMPPEEAPPLVQARFNPKLTRWMVAAAHVLDPRNPANSYTLFHSAPPGTAPAPPVQNEPNASAPIPRSAPCPCGSGEKYKRCCGKGAPPVLNNH